MLTRHNFKGQTFKTHTMNHIPAEFLINQMYLHVEQTTETPLNTVINICLLIIIHK